MDAAQRERGGGGRGGGRSLACVSDPKPLLSKRPKVLLPSRRLCPVSVLCGVAWCGVACEDSCYDRGGITAFFSNTTPPPETDREKSQKAAGQDETSHGSGTQTIVNQS